MNDAGLAALLPAADQTLFLKACLEDAPAAAEAWESWRRRATRSGAPVRRALAPVNAFLPLLAWNLQRHGVPLDRELATHLRAARMTEELRLQRYRAICASVVQTLTGAGISFIVLKGAALAATAYPDPLLRHADDIDLLLHEHDLEPAASLLEARGWRSRALPALPNPLHLPPLVHASGLPLELHRRLLIPYYTLPYDALWARSVRASVAGIPVQVLSPADTLIHITAHAMLGPPILRWIGDAWFILQRLPVFDWSVFTSTAGAARLHLPLFMACDYLSGEMGLPVPPHVLAELRAGAGRTSFVGRHVVRPVPQGSLASIWALPEPWWRRAARLCRRAFPSPVRFALEHDVRPWAVPAQYAYRLVRYARRFLPQSRRPTSRRAAPSARAGTRLD
jgi:hypothetical protein